MVRKRNTVHNSLYLERLEDRRLLTAGELDLTFDGDGIVTTAIGANGEIVLGVAIYPNAGTAQDGKIVAAGWSDNGRNADFAVARYNPDGSLDASFSGDGKLTTAIGSSSDRAWDVAVQSDGKIIAAGVTTSGTNLDFALVRYNLNGALDTSFGAKGKAITNFTGSGKTASHEEARAIALQADGKIVVAGSSNNDFAVARYNSNGSLDTSFSSDGKVTTDFGAVINEVRDMALAADGKIVVVGYTRHGADGHNDVMVVRYNPNGSLDTAFGGSGIVTFHGLGGNRDEQSVAVQADGKVVVAVGNWTGSVDELALIRFDANGSLDGAFDGDGVVITTASATSYYPEAVAVQADGKILVAGGSQEQGPPWRLDFLAARYNADGSPDATFGGSGLVTTPVASSGLAKDVAIQPDGKMVLAGWADTASGGFALARYLGDAAPLVAAAATTTVSQQSLSSTELQPIVAEAFRRWQAAGASTTALADLNVQIADLPGNLLGLASGRTVWLDRNAAGWGWFVDPSPASDSEFTLPGNQGEQNRMDLLTTVMHELGHVLGYDHDADGVMADALAAGIRETALDHDHAASVDRAFQDEYAAESWLTAWLGEQAETRAKSRR